MLLVLLLPLHDLWVGWANGEVQLGQFLHLRRRGAVDVVKASPIAWAGFL